MRKQGWKKKRENFLETFWELDIATLSKGRARLLETARLAGAVVRDFTDGRLSLWAMSLVYTTLLSFVPFLAISFSVLKGLGVHNQLEPFLLDLLRPLGPQSGEIVSRVLEFVGNIKVGILGGVGVAFLIYTVISMVEKVERSFNHIWNVTAGRSFARRFSDYLSVLLVWPLTMSISVALAASMQYEWIGSLDRIGLLPRLVPWFLMALAFTFIYMFIPNTRVRLGPAFIGGMVAAGFWKLLGFIFAVFVAGSASYAAVYSAFAALMLLIIWLYFGWLTVLIGADVSYYCQNPQNKKLARGHLHLSTRVREKAALAICMAIGRQQREGDDLLSVNALAERLKIPVLAVEEVLSVLVAGNILAETKGAVSGFVPARAFDTATVFDLLMVLRQAHEKDGIDDDDFLAGPAVEAAYKKIDRSLKEAFGDMPINSLYEGGKHA